eukprot:5873028-Pyramimonas_sp.AAC.1
MEISLGSLSVLLCADDALLIGRSQDSRQQLLGSIPLAGARVGMELHWDKFQIVKILGDAIPRIVRAFHCRKAQLEIFGCYLIQHGADECRAKSANRGRMGRVLQM